MLFISRIVADLFCSAKVLGFFSVYGIQITDLLTTITDYGTLTKQGMNKVVILN